jgi:periplasmic divalent cation tolerance protein
VSRDPRLVLTTVGSDADADRIAGELVENRLAACVNILPSVRSVYRWKGNVEREEELLLVIKTSADRIEELRNRLREIHPYELPEFLVIAPEWLGADYAAWIEESTR